MWRNWQTRGVQVAVSLRSWRFESSHPHSVALLGPSPLQISRFLCPVAAGATLPRSNRRGGFALQRTRSGVKAHWLLIQRRDGEARPGSDIVAERPELVISGRTLAQLLA
jgi:hypothetical protein